VLSCARPGIRAIQDNAADSGDHAPVHAAILSVGGNLDDVVKAFAAAINALRDHPQVSDVRNSSVWRTRPWGRKDQPDFLNMVLKLSTAMTPQLLLGFCQSLETAAGRVRQARWAPRTLDIDIVSFDDLSVNSRYLTIPHPRAHERLFVLAPMVQIAPEQRLRGYAVEEWLARLDNVQGQEDEAPEAVVDEDATIRLNALLQ